MFSKVHLYVKWWQVVLGFFLLLYLFHVIPLAFEGNAQFKPMFDKYIETFNKSYANKDEYETRFQHFLASLTEIETLNKESRGPDAYKAHYGLTWLSDMSKTEYKDIHLSDERVHKQPKLFGKSWNFKDSKSNENKSHGNVIRKKRLSIPLKMDWRQKGVISKVRNQGLCGACWAFSTVGAMEAMAAINTGKLNELSVQEAIDCAGLGNNGCAGGDICLLLDWLLLTDAPIETDEEYPLRLFNGACQAKKNFTGVRVKSFTCDDFVNSEEKILEAIATHGPVAVAVNALTWQNYLGGVIQYHCSGSLVDLNHAVELIGYDLTADVPYYIAKNSWGEEFGDSGYLKLAVGNNICGLANEVATVDVK